MLRVSIIIPAYNSERYLASTIEGVLAQSEERWELVIVDDGSKDSTPELIARYANRDPRIRSVSQPNAGIARTRNKGYALANPLSEFVIFLDHDDVWEPHALAVLIEALEANPASPAAYGIARSIDSSGAPSGRGEMEAWHYERRAVAGDKLVAWPKDSPATFATQIVENKIATVGQILIRRSALARQEIVFDPEYVPSDDWDLYLRLTRIGGIAFVPRVVIGWRNHDRNASRDRNIMGASADSLRARYAQSERLSLEERGAVLVANRHWQRRKAELRLTWARECLLRGDPVSAAKQLRHFAIGYARLLQHTSESPRGLSAHSQTATSAQPS